MHRLRRPAALLATSALALTLAACGGGDKPAPTGTAATNRSTTTPTSSTPSPSSTKPDSAKPDPKNYPHMNEKTEAGARATFDYFIDGYRYAMLTGDTSIIGKLSAESCKACRTIIADTKEKHGSVKSVTWKRAGAKYETKNLDVAQVVDRIDSAVTDSNSGAVAKQTIYAGARMGWNGKSWTIVDTSIEVNDA